MFEPQACGDCGQRYQFCIHLLWEHCQSTQRGSISLFRPLFKTVSVSRARCLKRSDREPRVCCVKYANALQAGFLWLSVC